ncbi:hypothetical protein QBC44DRAFT_374476 [Cladorrhinum sp. PSN332]|nr:hypothetical protein QBC44DRAFT_374476 [Cladorrhinum sp. PSN332]
MGGMVPDIGGGDIEDLEVEDPWVRCPKETSTTTKAAPTPKSSPMEIGSPTKNSAMCYNSGQKVNHNILDNAVASWCGDLTHSGIALGATKDGAITGAKTPSTSAGNVHINFSLDIFDGCEFPANKALCFRYLTVPVDSRNCNGVNGKQGGHVSNDCYIWRVDPNYGS